MMILPGVCTRLLPGDPRGARFMGMNPDHERDLKKKHRDAIHTLAARELEDEEFTVRGMLLCNSRRDYYYSRFSHDALREIAEMLPGAPVMRAHDYGTDAIGTFFDARVITDPRMAHLPKKDQLAVEALYYLPNDDAGQRMVRRIDLGIQREVSIGWRCAGDLCSVCGESIRVCQHIPGDIYRKHGLCEFEFSGITSVLEGSMVFRGGQKDTTTFIPEAAGERGREAAAIAGAGSRLIGALAGDADWSAIADRKRAFEHDFSVMPASVRAGIERFTRAQGFSLMCAEPGERDNTQAIEISGMERAAAARWCREHDFRADRYRAAGDSHVFEQFALDALEKDGIETQAIDKGVVARFGKRKPNEDALSRFLAGATAG